MFAHVHRETAMARAARAVFIHAAVCVALGHGAAFAQTGSIAGLVRDTSGAVLPGVTVEAASPVLIEKARTGDHRRTGQRRRARPSSPRAPSPSARAGHETGKDDA